jgi:hypothetical protein
MHALLILIFMWPLLSAAKITECWQYYPLNWHKWVVVLLTAAGAVAWFGIVQNGIWSYEYYDTPIEWDTSALWFWLAMYAGLGAVRYVVIQEAKCEPPTIVFKRRNFD